MEKSRLWIATQQTTCLILTLLFTIPFFISWLRSKGEHAGLYETGIGFAFFAIYHFLLSIGMDKCAAAQAGKGADKE